MKFDRLQYLLVGLWVATAFANLAYFLTEGKLSAVFYDTTNLGWSYFDNTTAFQFAFDEKWWAVSQWITVGFACAFYIPSYIKLRWFKSQQFGQTGNTPNIEIRLLILCTVSSV
jgi:hypothetical protein